MANPVWSTVTAPSVSRDDNPEDAKPRSDLGGLFYHRQDTLTSVEHYNTPVLDSVTSSWDNVTPVLIKITLPDTSLWAVALGTTWVAIAVSGIVSNAFLLLMALSKDLRVTSYGVCLASLAVVNGLLSVGRLLRAWFVFANTPSATLQFQISDEAVRIHLDDDAGVGLCAAVAVEYCLRAMEAWMTALLAIDRTLFLCFPLKRMRLCTARRALLAVLLIAFGCLVIYLPPITITLIKHYDQEEDRTGSRPQVRALLSEICTAIADWYRTHIRENAAFATLAPILLVAVCCCLLSAEVRSRVRKARQVILSEDCVGQALRRMSEQNRLSMSMVGVLLHFVLCALPASLLPLISRGQESNVGSNSTLKNITEFARASEDEARQSLSRVKLGEVLNTFASLNYSDVLWVLLASNRFFRRLLYRVVCARRANLDAELSRTNTKQRDAIRRRLDDFGKTTSGVIGVKLGWGRWRTARMPVPVVTGASARMASADLTTGYEVAVLHEEVSRSSSQASTETILRETATKLSYLPDTYKL